MSRFSGMAHSSSGDRRQNHGNCGTGIVGRLVRNEPERPVWERQRYRVSLWDTQADKMAVGAELRLSFKLLGRVGHGTEELRILQILLT